jgi:asparagine synthase (glutamine-hydrolysing)
MLNRMLDFDQRTMLCENYLMKADKMTMAHGVEERVPLLDLNVLAFSQAVPPELKIKGGNEKYILKQTMRDLLSEAITDRKKQGYGTPTAVWFRGELGRLFEKRVGRSEAFRRYFNLDYIKALLESHRSGKENNNTKLWSLLAFDLWYEIYILRHEVRPSGSYETFVSRA